MFYLSNIANSILERARDHREGRLSESEFGSRFQIIVAAALRSLPEYADLYENRGAGQPDCFSTRSSAGFEIKCRSTARVEIDPNGWSALGRFDHPILIAMFTSSPPYPIWVVDLRGRPETAIALDDRMAVDAVLERSLKPRLVELIESLGTRRIAEGRLEDMHERVSRVAGLISGPTAA